MTQRIFQQTTVAGQRPVLDNEIAMARSLQHRWHLCWRLLLCVREGEVRNETWQQRLLGHIILSLLWSSIWEKWGSKSCKIWIMCYKANSQCCMLPVFPLLSAVWGFNSSMPDTCIISTWWVSLANTLQQNHEQMKKWIYMEEELGTEARRLLFVQSIVQTCSCVALRLLLTA